MLRWLVISLVAIAVVSFAVLVYGVGIRSSAPDLRFNRILGTPGVVSETGRLPELVLQMGFDQNGTRLIARQEDGAIVSWNVASGDPAPIAQTSSVFAYCPARDRLVVNTDDAAVLLSLKDGAFTNLSKGRHDHAAFSADCSALAIAREDVSQVRLWRDAAPARMIPTAQPVRNSLMLSNDGHFLAAAGGTYSTEDGHRTALEIFDLNSDLTKPTVHLANPDEILGMWSMAFTADGAGLMLGSQVYGQAGLRYIETGTGAVRWGHDGFASFWVRALAVSPDGIMLATGDEKGYLRLWDVDTGTKLAEYRAGMLIQSLAFSRDGRQIAVSLWDGTIGLASVADLIGF